jgi:hypothetical protein
MLPFLEERIAWSRKFQKPRDLPGGQADTMADKIIDALKKGNELELIVKGRISGKDTSRPVWFALRNDELLLLPVTGSASQWFKNTVKNPKITITIAGQSYSGNAEPIRDKQKVLEVVELFRKKYGAGEVKKYYPRTDAASKVRLTR